MFYAMNFEKSNKKPVHYLFSGDNIAAYFVDFQLMNIYSEKFLPLYFIKHSNLKEWLSTRCIDKHRLSSRMFRRLLRFVNNDNNFSDDINIVLSQNAATLTDNYWIADNRYNITWEKVNPRNYFDQNVHDVAIRQSMDAFQNLIDNHTNKIIELTNIGSFEKVWRPVSTNDNSKYTEWELCKKGSRENNISELIAYNLSKLFGMSHAEYYLPLKTDISLICSKDLTADVYNFEPMWALVGDDEDYVTTIDELNNINLICQYLNIIFIDTLISNPDRHTFNYGLLKNKNSGDIICMAPNFDNNLSLMATNDITKTRSNDILIKLFSDALNYVYKNTGLNWIQKCLPIITKEQISNNINNLNEACFLSETEKLYIVDFIYNRYKQIVKKYKI